MPEPTIEELRQAVINAEDALAEVLCGGGLGSTCPVCSDSARSDVRAVYLYLHRLVRRLRRHGLTLRKVEVPDA